MDAFALLVYRRRLFFPSLRIVHRIAGLKRAVVGKNGGCSAGTLGASMERCHFRASSRRYCCIAKPPHPTPEQMVDMSYTDGSSDPVVTATESIAIVGVKGRPSFFQKRRIITVDVGDHEKT